MSFNEQDVAAELLKHPFVKNNNAKFVLSTPQKDILAKLEMKDVSEDQIRAFARVVEDALLAKAQDMSEIASISADLKTVMTANKNTQLEAAKKAAEAKNEAEAKMEADKRAQEQAAQAVVPPALESKDVKPEEKDEIKIVSEKENEIKIVQVQSTEESKAPAKIADQSNPEKIDLAQRTAVINMLILHARDLTNSKDVERAKLLVTTIDELNKKFDSPKFFEEESLKKLKQEKVTQKSGILFWKTTEKSTTAARLLRAVIVDNAENIYDYRREVLVSLLADGLTEASEKELKNAIKALAMFIKKVSGSVKIPEGDDVEKEFEMVEIKTDSSPKPIANQELINQWNRELSKMSEGLKGDGKKLVLEIQKKWQDIVLGEKRLMGVLGLVKVDLNIQAEPRPPSISTSNLL